MFSIWDLEYNKCTMRTGENSPTKTEALNDFIEFLFIGGEFSKAEEKEILASPDEKKEDFIKGFGYGVFEHSDPIPE